MSFGTEITRDMLIAEEEFRRENLYKGRRKRRQQVERRVFVADCKSKVTITYKPTDLSTFAADSDRLYCSFGCKACEAKIQQAIKIIQNGVDNKGLLSVM